MGAHIEGSGTETLKDSSATQSASKIVNTFIPSGFIQFKFNEPGDFVMGTEHIPGTTELVARTQTRSHLTNLIKNDIANKDDENNKSKSENKQLENKLKILMIEKDEKEIENKMKLKELEDKNNELQNDMINKQDENDILKSENKKLNDKLEKLIE
jgi:hypothetical protein